jgi:hypothetical protein
MKTSNIYIYIKEEPLDISMQRMQSIESKVESILTTIKKESIKSLAQEYNGDNFDIDIDLNLLNKNKLDHNLPLIVPLLKKPPANSCEQQQSMQPKIKPQEPIQQSIPIISITNFNNHLIDPRIEFQNKHLQNQLKKFFMIVSANNHQQIKLNNSLLINENPMKLDYNLEELKTHVETNLRNNLIKFHLQILLSDYYDITCQLECIFVDFAILQERVCSDHSYLSNLYEYLNEVKLVFAVKLKSFFKMNILPGLFEKILKPIPLSYKMRLSYVSTIHVDNEIRDPRIRKQQETQIKASILKEPTEEMLNKKYILDLKCLNYNLSNETPTSPALIKIQKQEQKLQPPPPDQLIQKNNKIVSERSLSPLLMSSPNEFTQELCENIRKNVINETNTVKQEEIMHQVLNFIKKIVQKNTEQKMESKNNRKRSRARYNRSRSSSNSSRHKRSRSQHRDKNNKKRSKSRSRSRSRSRQRRKHSRSSRYDRTKSKRDRSAASSSASTKSSTPVSEGAATSTTVTTKTKTKIFFNNQENNEVTKHDSQIINKRKHSLLV